MEARDYVSFVEENYLFIPEVTLIYLYLFIYKRHTTQDIMITNYNTIL